MSDAEQQLDALKMIAPYIEQQARFDQAIMNRHADAGWTAAAEWAERFSALFEAIDKANDSIRVARILDDHWRPDPLGQAAHYRRQMISKDAR